MENLSIMFLPIIKCKLLTVKYLLSRCHSEDGKLATSSDDFTVSNALIDRFLFSFKVVIELKT